MIPVSARRQVSTLVLITLFVSLGTLTASNGRTFLGPQPNLMWVADARYFMTVGVWGEGSTTREEGHRLVAAMNAGALPNFGHRNWRLATVGELKGLYQAYVNGTLNEPVDNFTSFEKWIRAGQSARRAPTTPHGWIQGADRLDDRVFAWPVRAATSEGQFQGLAVFATNSVQLNRETMVTGDVAVQAASPGPVLDSGVEVSVGRDAVITGDVKGDSVLLNRGSAVSGDVQVNELDDRGADIGGQILPFMELEAPPFQQASVRASAPDVLVGAGEVVTLPAGEYGDVSIARFGTLVFEGGVFNLRSITQDTSAGGVCPYPCRTIAFDGPTDLRVAGLFDTGKDARIGPGAGSQVSAAEVVVYVAGLNGGDGSPGALPSAAWVGQGSSVDATLYAANGTLRIDKEVFGSGNGGTAATGAFLGRDVLLDNSSKIIADSFFRNLPPVAFPQTLVTNGGSPLLITLAGVDPEMCDLVFSIVTPPVHGTLSAPTPIVPDPIPDPENPGQFVQPPITQATATYTPDDGQNLTDSFVFAVIDSEGAMGTAVVDINPVGDPTTPPVLDEILAEDGFAETDPATAIDIGLQAGGPPAVTLAFSIESLPAHGGLSEGSTAIESVPFALSGPTVTYTPDLQFIGTDVFQFGVADSDPMSALAPDSAMVSVNVAPRPELVEDQSLETPLNTPLQVTLFANLGGVGAPQSVSAADFRLARSTPRGGVLFALPGADVAGNVSDANGDGLGDGRDDLPGSAPVLVAAGVDVNLGATPSGSVTDPSGDAFSDSRDDPADPDLVSASVSSDGTNLNLSVRFVASGFSAATSRGSFVLDIDENPATGFPGIDSGNNDSALLGIEFLVNVGADLGANAQVIKFISPPNNFSLVGTFAASVLADGYDVSIPLSTLDGDDGRMTFKVETQSYLGAGFTGILDYMPDLGLAPGQSRSGVQGVARVEIEWDISGLGVTSSDEIESAQVTLTTNKGSVDSLDTFFFAGTQDQDGLLTVSDFQTEADQVPGVVMPVPVGAPSGTEGTFTFGVTNQLKAAVSAGFSHFTIQGRVDEGLAGGGFQRGLQIRSTASGNLMLGNEPQLDVVTQAPASNVVWAVLTLPSNGTLTTLAGAPVLVGDTFGSEPTLLYTPLTGFTGPDMFSYQVTQNLVVDAGIVSILVNAADECVANGRPPGCSPGGE